MCKWRVRGKGFISVPIAPPLSIFQLASPSSGRRKNMFLLLSQCLPLHPSFSPFSLLSVCLSVFMCLCVSPSVLYSDRLCLLCCFPPQLSPPSLTVLPASPANTLTLRSFSCPPTCCPVSHLDQPLYLLSSPLPSFLFRLFLKFAKSIEINFRWFHFGHDWHGFRLLA